MTRLLFVCTANRVRSPFAEAATRDLLAASHPTIEVASAGFLEGGLAPVSTMVDVAMRMGHDLRGHLSRTVEAWMLAESDLVVAMTGAHVVDLVGVEPTAARRILTLQELAHATPQGAPPDWDDGGAVRAWAAGPTARPLQDLLRGDHDVADPIGGPKRAYKRAATEIEALLRTAFDVSDTPR